MPHVSGEDEYQAIEVLAGGGYGGEWGPYVAPNNPFTVGQFYNPVDEPPRPRAPPEIFPTVRILGNGNGTAPEDSATPGPEALPAEVVDPEYRPTTTVFEDAPGGIYETSRAPTDWDAVYNQYVILNAPEADVPFHDSIDWGEIAGTVIGGIFDPFGMGAATQAGINQIVQGGAQAVPNLGTPVTGITGGVVAGAACPPIGPKYAKICLATNVITPLRRRRRRRLLTSSDIKDLAALKAIVGGAALQGAVVQAIRR